MTTRRTPIFLACFASLGAACLNVDPVDYQAPDGAALDSTVPDALTPEGETETDGALTCYSCIEAPDEPGPGCGDEYAACTAQPVCKAIMDCVFAAGCFYASTTKDFVVCAIPCASEAGVTSTSDPIVQLGLNVAYCADKVCRAFCGGGETGS